MTDKEAHSIADNEVKEKGMWAGAGDLREEKVYTYDEAIDLTGNGLYNIMLLLTMDIAVLAMAVDLFGLSVVASGATCDFHLNLGQTGVLLSVTFIGPVVMSYPWGYLSDTQGRRKCLLVSLWTSFIVSAVSAFSTNWIVMAVLKLIGASFCAQSATYTLLGESCPRRRRDAYIVVTSSVPDLCLAFYVGFGCLILNLDFSYDLGFVTFAPWRLLVLVLALPLGIGAFALHFSYESPKFLLNAGRDGQALETLAGIWRRNGGKGDYPVKRLVLDEEGNDVRKDVSLLQSLWQQVYPIFTPPLLWRSLQLYCLTTVVFGVNNAYYTWFPLIADKFIKGVQSSTAADSGLCNVVVSSYMNTTENAQCSSDIDSNIFWISLAQGMTFVLLVLAMTSVIHLKRTLVIVILLTSGLSAVGAVLIREKFTSFVMYSGVLANELCIGIIYSYYVDLYPTSFRGMAACINAMLARAGALAGVNLVGDFITTHCADTFYVCSGLMMGGVVLACLLPPDKSIK